MLYVVMFVRLGYSLEVTTHVLPACGGCDTWSAMISGLAPEFPELEFNVLVEDPSTLTSSRSFPYTTVVLEDVSRTTLRYPYKKDVAYLRRWLSDLTYGRYSLVQNVSASFEWFNGFASWMHVLSSEYPRELNGLSKRYLSTGFAWTYTNRSSYENTVLVQPFLGNLRMQVNVASLQKEMRHVFPAFIPVELALNYTDYLYSLYVQELHVYSNKTLPAHWGSFKEEYPGVAVIQMPSKGEDAVWSTRRSVQFKYDGLDAGVSSWYGGILRGETNPWYRLSAEPVSTSDDVVELSGDSMWSFVLGHRKALVYEYDEATVVDCEQNVLTRHPLGRLDVRTNDHESLPVASSAGWVHYYLNGRIRKSFKCVGADAYLHVLDTALEL